jgi:hypothetical protein
MSAAANASAQSLDRTGTLFSPCLEWKLENPDHPANPFDLEATAIFTHKASGETRRTGMFFDGNATWKFRFTGTRTGEWTFVTRSSAPALNGRTGAVSITVDRTRPARGFVTSVDGNRWAWQTGESPQNIKPFVPQLVMGRDLEAYRRNPEKIDEDIQTWLVDHGFNGIHVGVLCRWFDFDQAVQTRFPIPIRIPTPARSRRWNNSSPASIVPAVSCTSGRGVMKAGT